MKLKKLLLFSIVLLIVPLFVISFFKQNNNKKGKFNYEENEIVRVYKQESNVIEYVPLEEYIIGVVSTEVPISFNKEALKAQAVASRTYVIYQKRNNGNTNFDVYDSNTIISPLSGSPNHLYAFLLANK